MKKIDFRTSGALPLTSEEEQSISGGSLWLKILGAGVAVGLGEIIHDWDNFKSGLMGLPERKRS